MSKLTKILVPALAIAATLGTAGAASAQPYGGYDHGRDWGNHQTPARAEAIRNQIAMLEQRVNRNETATASPSAKPGACAARCATSVNSSACSTATA